MFIAILVLAAVSPAYPVAGLFNTKVNNKRASFSNKSIHQLPQLLPAVDDNMQDTTKRGRQPIDSLAADSDYLPRTSSALKSKVKYTAKDSITYSASSKTAILYNDAQVLYENLNMKSARITINLADNTINAAGITDSLGTLRNTPIFKEGDAEYKIEEVTFNYETKRGFMKEFRTKEDEGYVKGERVKRDEFNNFYLRDAYYTTCDADEPHFYIKAEKLKVVPGKRVITGPANMVIEGVRTPLFIPFGIFPLKRGQQSGIIIPLYGYAGGRGYFLRQGGYYLGLGDHWDASFIGDIYANLSWQLGIRTNYAYRYRFAGSVNANYATNIQGLPEDVNYNKSNAFQFIWQHSLDPRARPGTSFRADVSLYGNQYLSRNTYTVDNSSFKNNIVSTVSYSHGFNKNRNNLYANTQVSQNLATRDISITFPDITFTIGSFQPFKPRWKSTADSWLEKFSMNYTGLLQNRLTTKDSLLFRNRSNDEWKSFLDTVMSNGIKHSTSLNNSFNVLKYYTVSMGASYNENWTLKTFRHVWDTASKRDIKVPVNEFARSYSYSFTGGVSTRFYGLVNFKRGRLKAVRHVVNPDIGFTYVPDFGQAHFGFYRTYQVDSTGRTGIYSIFDGTYFGGPSAGRQGNINFGIDNNLEIKWLKGKDTTEKVEKIKIFESLRGGAAYNIFADSFNLSNIAITFRTTLFKSISLNGGLGLDPYMNVITVNNEGKTKYYQRFNKFAMKEQGIPGTVTNANLGLSASLNPEMFRSKNKARAEAIKKEMMARGFTEFKMPWTLSLSYTVSYDYRNKLQPVDPGLNQNLQMFGTLTPSKNWGITFNSGYDFKDHKISNLGIDIKRDLHCWQFTCNWTPISAMQSQYFLFTISVKAQVLSDLKYPKRKDWFDNRRI